MLLKNNYHVMTTAPTFVDPTAGRSALSVRFSLEFLQGCTYQCPGCFVKKDNDYSQKDLDVVAGAIAEFERNGAHVDQIILGPTDFFAAKNTEGLLREPKFKALFEGRNRTLILFSTLQDNDERIARYMTILDEEYEPLGADVEFFVIFDLAKVLGGDKGYVEELKRKIQLFDRHKITIDYALQLNIRNIEAQDLDLAEITRIVRKEFDTCVEFNPSFLRSGRERLTHTYLQAWKTFLSTHVHPGNVQDILLSQANHNHAGFSEETFNYANGEFYISPFIYENVFDRAAAFKIEKSDGETYRYQDFLRFREQSNVAQYAYMNTMDECRECPHAHSCVGKHVVYFMEHNGISSCPLPKDVFSMYNLPR